MASAETNPSNPLLPVAEPFVIQIEPFPNNLQPSQPVPPPNNHHGCNIQPMVDPISIAPPKPSSTPSSNDHHGSNIQPMADPISIPPPKPSSKAQENQGLNTTQPSQTHYVSMGEPSTVVQQQNYGLLSSMLEQLLSQVIRQQPPPPPADYPSTPPPPPPPPAEYPSTPPPPPCMGSFNLKVEPIFLNINSSVPLQTHDQSNSQLNKTQSSSQQPSLSPPPSKQEPNQTLNPPSPPADQHPTGQRNQSLRRSPSYIKQQKVLENAGNLANLLPTGTVLAFQALAPTLSNNGRCHHTNKVLVACIIGVCTIICFLSSFTDSLNDGSNVYYGIATCKGLLVFNQDNRNEGKNEETELEKKLEKLKISIIDFVHAFGTVAVFLIFAISSTEVQGCYFPRESTETRNCLVMYLPLVAGIVTSFLFTIFPTKRRGIGYIDFARGR